MIQYNTKNLSFKRMHVILKRMGIENNSFFLQLYDEDLLNVDPFDEEKLSDITKYKIIVEIKRNPWYFFREIVRFPNSEKKERFILDRGTLAIVWAALTNLEYIIELPRQCFKTYTVSAIYTWLTYWGGEGFEAMLFSYSEPIVAQNINRIKSIRDTLPKYLNFKNEKTDVDNKSTLTFKTDRFENKIGSKAPGHSVEAATKVGRGFSTHFQWWDEMAHIPYVQHQYGSAIYAYSTVSRVAEASNSRHHIIMTTTPGNKNSDVGKWTYEFFKNAAQFDECLYDMVKYDKDNVPVTDRKRVKEYILNNGKNSMFLYIRFMWYELSKPVGYFEQEKRKSPDEDTFNREVLLQWSMSNTDHPLGKRRVEQLLTTIQSPVKTLIIDNIYFFKLYRDPEVLRKQSKQIVFGMDCSGNTGRDFSTFVGLDITNNEVVATMRINQHSVTRFSNAVSYALTYLFPESILIGERNDVGKVVLEMVVHKIGLRRVYCEPDNDGKLGVTMTKSLRSIMYDDILRTSVIEHGDKIHDRYIINEISDLKTNKRTGRIDHSIAGHDDVLIGYLYTRWFVTYCKNKNSYVDEILFNFEKFNDMDEMEIEEIMEKNNDKYIYNTMYGNKVEHQMSFDEKDNNSKFTDPSWVQQRNIRDYEQQFNNPEGKIFGGPSSREINNYSGYEDAYRRYSDSKKITGLDVKTTTKDELEYSGNVDKDEEDEMIKKVDKVKDVEPEKEGLFHFDFRV